MITKRIKLPQRSKAPGELRYKLYRCGLREDATSSDRAIRAGSSAFENSQAKSAGVDQPRGRPCSGRKTIVKPTRTKPRSTASRRQSSNSAELTIENERTSSMASPNAITAIWHITLVTSPLAMPRVRLPDHQPGLRCALARLKQSYSSLVCRSSAACVSVAVAGAAACSGVGAAARTGRGATACSGVGAAARTGRGTAARAARAGRGGAASTRAACASAARAARAGAARAASARAAGAPGVVTTVVAARIRRRQSQRAD